EYARNSPPQPRRGRGGAGQTKFIVLTNTTPALRATPPRLRRGINLTMKKRTIISIEEYQPELDFEEAEHSPQFTFPEYQRDLLAPRIAAGLTDLAIVLLIYLIFLVTTYLQMPEPFTPDKRVLGIYGVCYFTLVVIYFFLFMLSASQTPGMKHRGLVVV